MIKKITYITIILFILVFGLSGITGDIIPDLNSGNTDFGGIFESSLDRARYAQAYSLVNSSSLYVNDFVEFSKPDVAFYNQNYIPAFPVFPVLLISIFYFVGKILGISTLFAYSTNIFIVLLSVLTLLNISKKLKFSSNTSLFVVLVNTLGSFSLAYSTKLSAHFISAFLLLMLLNIYLITKRNPTIFHFVSALVIFLLNLFVDYPNLVISFPLMFVIFNNYTHINILKTRISFLLTYKHLIAFITVLLMAFMFIFYNINIYGKAFVLSNTYNVHILERAGYSNGDDFNYAQKFSVSNLFKGLPILLFSLERGLFIYSPIFIFSLLGIYFLYRDRKTLARVFILTFILNLIIYGSYDDPWGGWSFGPRYLIISIPLLSILVGYFYNRYGYFLVNKIIILLLYLPSAFVSLLGLFGGTTLAPSVESSSYQTVMINYHYVFSSGYLSSFLYNTFLQNYISSTNLFVVIFTASTLLLCFLIFPRREFFSTHES